MAISPVPIKRDAFLYMEGEGDKQCQTCWLWDMPALRCKVLPAVPEVRGEDSCGYWGYGELDQFYPANLPQFTSEEVGFVRREVRCENCYHFDKGESECYFYEKLNSTLPKIFDLDVAVKPHGCCNAQTPRRARVVS